MVKKNLIKKDLHSSDSSDSDDNDITVNTKKDNKTIIFDAIWGTRLKMINYCDEMCIPLCEYLDQGIMEEFVKFLSES